MAELEQGSERRGNAPADQRDFLQWGLEPERVHLFNEAPPVLFFPWVALDLETVPGSDKCQVAPVVVVIYFTVAVELQAVAGVDHDLSVAVDMGADPEQPGTVENAAVIRFRPDPFHRLPVVHFPLAVVRPEPRQPER